VEISTPERVAEFDAAEAELAEVLARRSGKWLSPRVFLDANMRFSAAKKRFC